MSLKPPTPSGDSRTRLAHALGYHDYPSNATAEPYLSYIDKGHHGEVLEDYRELFIAVIEHFDVPVKGSAGDDSIQALIDKFSLSGFRGVFKDTGAGDPMRREHVEDMVMCIIGTWTTMLSSFQHRCRSRKITAAYTMFLEAAPSKNPYQENVAGLILGSQLLPGGRWDHRMDVESDAAVKLMMLLSNATNSSQSSIHNLLTQFTGQLQASSNKALQYQLLEDLDTSESLSITAKRLNAFTLNVLSAVDISWTPNISRHMLLTKIRGRYVLELFSLPCAFDVVTSSSIGLSQELTLEIQESYAMLFNAWPDSSLHTKLGSMLPIRWMCWCWSCSAYRFRRRCIVACKEGAGARPRHRRHGNPDLAQSDFDPMLETLMVNQSMKDWTPDDFPHLWTRIVRLEQHLQTSRPWSIWVLFRDRRDTMQFWTFLFATVVVFLTIVQVLLGVAQVVGSFI